LGASFSFTRYPSADAGMHFPTAEEDLSLLFRSFNAAVRDQLHDFHYKLSFAGTT
jgi:hypothetical protein